jgi:dihydrofolate synthase/folylpolyglutamate synthase
MLYKGHMIEHNILQTLDSLHFPRTEASTAPFTELMSRLDNPHKKLPKTIHVTGTNGKGSVLAYLDSILKTAGYRVHRYTSPHLVSICERIQIANTNIRAEDFYETLQAVAPHTKGLELTIFEMITAVAFLKFAENPADYLLLETGIGGRHDSTNIIENPVVTVITQIGLDHMEKLGPTLTLIAGEKAGIIKHGRPTVTLNHEPEIVNVILEEARLKNSPLFFVEKLDTQLSLIGAHQQMNAALAHKAAMLLNACPEDVILQGLKTTQWAGRMQSVILHGRKVWLDMAHNPSAALAAVQSMIKIDATPFRLIFSLRENKDVEAFLRTFKNHVCSVTYVPLNEGAQGHDANAVKVLANHLHMPMDILDSLKMALSNIPDSPILITGSAILVGEALKLSLDG